MVESSKNEQRIRDYLLGRISDAATLEEMEELLFTDEEFCSQVALAEDGIINDYVLGYLNEADAASFRATLAGDPERSARLALTQWLREKALSEKAKGRAVAEVSEDKPSFFASLRAFFTQPKYVGAFALLLLAVLASVVYFAGRRSGPDELAQLRALYKQERPTRTRLAQFDYAPFAQLRGAQESREKNQLRRIENQVSEDAEKNPNARTHHALGVFYLTQQKPADAIKELESAAKLADKDAQIHNDLGAAYFELAQAAPKEQRLEALAHALEEFTKATELDQNSLEALFNKALALQELGMPEQAKQFWSLYLRRDSSSPWAEEARRNLARLESQQSRFKSDEQVLDDFLTAYREHDEERAQRIHNETKGLLRDPAVPLQLSRRYLKARLRGDEAEARESIEALSYIGSFEQAKHSEFFFLS